jgi:hypothetical protein
MEADCADQPDARHFDNAGALTGSSELPVGQPGPARGDRGTRILPHRRPVPWRSVEALIGDPFVA